MALEEAVGRVHDFDSLFDLLRDDLEWPLDPSAASDDATFAWTANELRVQDSQATRLKDGIVQQLKPFSASQPWGIFHIQFTNGHIYRTALRQVLRGLVPNRRRNSNLPEWNRENLLFLCTTNDYDRFSFAHFRGDDASRATLAQFEWERNDTHIRTLCEYNLSTLRFPDDGGVDTDAWLTDWQEAWSVEKVTQQFFAEYRLVFQQVENAVQGVPKGERLRIYTQRLFNRLIFLYFIQKKGWLSFRGDKNYLRALFTTAHELKEDFLNDRLYWTFFYGLNTLGEDAEVHSLDELRERRGDVPFLNGGLFDFEDRYDQLGKVKIPNQAFAAILDLFERYNFTVSESTPLDIEVAVDPEILGKMFEELVTDRHGTGSYYTPRPVVSFMCREGLKHYLADAVPNDDPEIIHRFVDYDDPSALPDPEGVLDALKAVKVCDPACGSGAYLLGMMQELLRLRQKLFVNSSVDTLNQYQRKLEIVQNNLYGVDIDPFAVNIAQLRLWLSLAVEYDGDEPEPLPNLSYKIEIGDSLTAPNPQELPTLLQASAEPIAQALQRLKGEFLRSAHEVQRKKALRTAIEEKERGLRGLLGDTAAPETAIEWRVAFAEIFVPEQPTATIDEVFKQQKLPKGQHRAAGFDIVLANPPYLRQEVVKRQFGDDYKDLLVTLYPEAYIKTADIYVAFYVRAHQLLKPNGIGCFISSNKWLRAGYGKKLREHLLDSQAFHLVLDFGDQPVFQAVAYPCIFLWKKQPRGDTPTTWGVVKDLQACYDEGVREHIDRISETLPASQFGVGKPRLTSPAAADRHAKMEASGQRLGELVKGQILRGILTGLNKAFIIDSVTREQLIDEDPKSAEIIKPLLAGDNVRRYELHFRETYLIWTYIGVPIKRYPSVFAHLKQFQVKAEKRGDQGEHWWELRACDYYAAFDRPKIIYGDISTESRFAMDTDKRYVLNTSYVIPDGDWYVLAVLNSAPMERYFREISATIRGGYLRFIRQYVETIPIPDASTAQRETVAKLAQEAQWLHTQRRGRVEQLLRSMGVPPTTRNPLEQLWTMTKEALERRVRGASCQLGFQARDETVALTEQIAQVEREIDERVADLYGVDLE